MTHALLVQHLLDHSVRTGDFTLKSGRKSGWFIDSKQTMCRPDGALLVADLALDVIGDEIGSHRRPDPRRRPGRLRHRRHRGDPGAPALRSFAIRKEVKDHGVVGRLAGALEPGDQVVITEDTVTRGASPLEAARVVRELGAEPVMILVIVDRGGTCAAMAEAEGIGFHALVTAPDLGFDYEGA